MAQAEDTPSRFSTFAFGVRLVGSIVVTVLAIGAGLYYLVATDRVDSTIASRASTIGQVVQSALEPAVTADDTGSAAASQTLVTEAIDTELTPLFDSDLVVRVVALDGTVLFSTEADESDVRLGTELFSASVLRGVSSGRLIDGETTRVIYSVPLAAGDAAEGSERVVAAARIDVADDAVVAESIDDASRLVYLFGGALLGIIVALIPLCWWSLGEVRRQFRRTRVLAMSDTLTGLANRTQFHDRIEESVAAASRSKDCVGLVMIDLDGFKAINDNGGHAAGDRLLKRVASALGEATRRNEIPCRIGGDEFAVVAPRISNRDELRALADRLHAQLDMEVAFSDGRSLRVTASLGLALYPDDAHKVEDLIAKADKGMYAVKASRKAKLPADARSRAAAGR